MDRYAWSKLTHLQIGRYAEYYTKMEFTACDFDVYTAEVDDKGIDFVVRTGIDAYYDVQVKSSRALNYIFIRKSHFAPRKNLLAAVVLFLDGQPPDLFLIPSTAWLRPHGPLVDRTYTGRATPPEWGLNLSKKTMPLMEEYRFEKVAPALHGAHGQQPHPGA